MRRYLAAGLLSGFLSLIPASAVSSDNSSIQFEGGRVIRIDLSRSQSQHQEDKININQSVELDVINNITVSPEPAARIVQTTIPPTLQAFSPAGTQRVALDTKTKGGVTHLFSPSPSPASGPAFQSQPTPASTPTPSPLLSPLPSPIPQDEDQPRNVEAEENGGTESPSVDQEPTATTGAQEAFNQRSFFGRIYDGIRDRLHSIGRFLRSIGLG